MEKTRIEVNSPHGLKRVGVKEDTVESHMVRSLKMILEYERKVIEWFRFEKKADEFDWSCERQVGPIVNMLKGKPLEGLKVYDNVSK